MKLNRQGFSILLALGTISVLLIVVTSLSIVYMRELKLSRLSYDEILASESAEWAFEYAMLKVHNHPDGFQDAMQSTDPDGKMFALGSTRSNGLQTSYVMTGASSDYTFSLKNSEQLIVPLFAAKESLITGSTTSKRALLNANATKVSGLSITGISGLKWTIVGTNTSGESIGIAGEGDLTDTTSGTIRHQTADCYDQDGNKIDCHIDAARVAETLPYYYDESKKIADFIAEVNTPFVMIYNSNTSTNIHIKTLPDTPFTLPQLVVQASSRNGDSFRTYRFAQDKSQYYDALKYWVYNNSK